MNGIRFGACIVLVFSASCLASKPLGFPDTTGSTEADVSISASDGASVIEPGSSVTWSILVANAGPDAALAQVHDFFPSAVSGVTWTCAATGTAICSTSGSSTISDVVYLPSGGSIAYTATGQLTAPRGTTVSNNALVGTLNGIVDTDTSNNVSTDSFLVDFVYPPRISRVDAASNPLGCNLRDGIETKSSVTQVALTFSQPMTDPPGNASLVDVTNPANYSLIGAGADQVLQTSVCGVAPAGDDLFIPIRALNFDPTGNRVFLQIDDVDGLALPSGNYRVLACATGLQRVTGMALDGDGDGTSGDDFESDFTILETNVLANPNFDEPPGVNWMHVLSHDTEVDADDIKFSGSLFGQTGNANGMSVCQKITEPGSYQFGFRARTSADALIVQLSKHANSLCTDGALASFNGASDAPTSGFFNRRLETVPVPYTAVEVAAGAWLHLFFVLPASTPAGRADSAYLRRVGDKLFGSPFESPGCMP